MPPQDSTKSLDQQKQDQMDYYQEMVNRVNPEIKVIDVQFDRMGLGGSYVYSVRLQLGEQTLWTDGFASGNPRFDGLTMPRLSLSQDGGMVFADLRSHKMRKDGFEDLTK